MNKSVLLLLLIGILIICYPYFWGFRVSLMPYATTYIVDLFAPATLDNYSYLIFNTLFPRWVFNTLFIAIIVSITNTFFCLLGGYALARNKVVGSKVLFSLTLFSMAVPQYILIVPLFFMMASVNLLDNYLSVILPLAVDPFGIFLIRQYIISIPENYEEAAKIDGCSDFNMIWKIILPLCKPALVVLIATEFINTLNNFIYPLIMFYSPSMQTITLGIANFSYATLNVNWGATMAASILGSIFPALLLLLLSRKLIEGFMLGGIKG